MTTLLRLLLDIREKFWDLKQEAQAYGVLESMPEIDQMMELERQVFAKVNEWDKPS